MKTHRPLNEKDRKVLDRLLKEILGRERYQFRVLLGWCGLSLVGTSIAWFTMDPGRDRWFALGTGAIFVAIGIWGWLETSTKNRRQRSGVDFVKAQNSVTSIRVQSKEHIELPETEDEGVYYLFQLADGKVISIGGQEFYPTRSFPSDDFEIVLARGPRSEWVLYETHNLGEKIKPIRKIKGEEKSRLMSSPNYPDPEEFTIVEGTLADIESLSIAGNAHKS